MLSSVRKYIVAAMAVFFGLDFHIGRSVADDPAPGVPVSEKASEAAQPKGELDKLLDMDLESLSKVSVKGTELNPEIEAVSKKAETISESPGIVQVITAKQIHTFGAKNLREVLNWATSIYMTGSYLYPNNAISMRGDLFAHYSNHVLPLINGRPFRDMTNTGLSAPLLMSFPLEAIDHIEIIRGPGSVLYGSNAYAGVINVVTKRTEEATSVSQSRAGSFGTQQYSHTISKGDDEKGYMFSGVYNRNQGFPFTATGEQNAFQNPRQTQTTQLGNDNIGFVGNMYFRDWNITTFVSDSSQAHLGTFPIWPAKDLEMQRVFLNVGHTWKHSEAVKTQLNYTFNFHAHTWLPPNAADANAFSNLLELTHHRALTQHLDFITGGFIDFQSGKQTPLVDPWKDTWYGVYSQLEYRPTDRLKLIGGIQGNIPGEIQGGISPRGGVIYNLSKELTAKFLYGEAFRSPSPLERFIQSSSLAGNPNLTPETIATIESQLAYSTERFRSATTYFHSQYHDVIDRIGTTPPSYANLAGITFQGVELESQYLPNDNWMYLLGVTYQENTNSDGMKNTTLVPNWQGKVGIAYDNLRGIKVGLFDTIFSKPESVTLINPSAALVNPEENSYQLVSLDARYDIGRFLRLRKKETAELEFLVQNLLDEEQNHPEFSRKLINTLPNGGGRAFYGGFSIQF